MKDVTYWLKAVGSTMIEASGPIKDLGCAISDLSGVLASLSSPDRTIEAASISRSTNRLERESTS